MRKPSEWTHPKRKRKYVGSYERTRSGYRVFVLTSGKTREVFESNEDAKEQGWKKKA